MGQPLGDAVVEVRADLRQLGPGLARAEGEARGFVGRANKILGGLGGRGLGLAAGLGGAVAAGGTGAALAGAARAASDLGESVQKAQAAFRANSKTILKDADDLADRFGLVKRESIDAAVGFGLMMKAAGMAGGEAARLGVEMTRLSADVSSFFNIPMAEAMEKLRAGLAGEAEPLRVLGVFLSEDAVKAEALRLGLAKTGKELTEQAKIRARLSLIKNAPSMKDAAGDLARTADSAANQLRKFQGDLENLKADFGKSLIGPLTEGLKLARELGAALSRALGEGAGDAAGSGLAAAIRAARMAIENPVGTLSPFDNPVAGEFGLNGQGRGTLQARADALAGVKTFANSGVGRTAEEQRDYNRQVKEGVERVKAAEKARRAELARQATPEARRAEAVRRLAAQYDQLSAREQELVRAEAARIGAAMGAQRRLQEGLTADQRRALMTPNQRAAFDAARAAEAAEGRRAENVRALAGVGKTLGAGVADALKGSAGALFGGSRFGQAVGRAQLGKAADLGLVSRPAATLLAGAGAALRALKEGAEKPETRYGSGQVLQGADSFSAFAHQMIQDFDPAKTEEQVQQLEKANEFLASIKDGIAGLRDRLGGAAAAVLRGPAYR